MNLESSRDTDIRVVPLDDGHIEGVLDALTGTFGSGFDRPWFEWKHRSGPWGPSPGWVAISQKRVVGVRLFLRWRFTSDDGTIQALRPCDTVVVPSHRGQGLFRRLTIHGLEHAEANIPLVFNTPNANSRPGYLKMGFREWARVKQVTAPILGRKAALEDAIEPPTPGKDLATERTAVFYYWRYQTCPTHSYRVRSLAFEEKPHGIVYRIRTWRGTRLAVIADEWGPPPVRRALLRAIAADEGIHFARRAAAIPDGKNPGISTSRTIVTRFLRDPSIEPGRVRFTLGDIEAVL